MALALVSCGAKVAFLTPSHIDALLPFLAHVTAGPKGRNRFSVYCAAPTTDPAPQLRHLVCCGEALSAATVGRFYATFHSAAIHNLYGPTEGSMTWFPCPRGCEEVLIGKPISNTVVLVVDEDLKPVSPTLTLTLTLTLTPPSTGAPPYSSYAITE